MTEPHPLRCETCKKFKEGTYHDSCDKLLFPDQYDSAECEYIKKWIKIRGCASHSSTTSAGEVLEQIERKLKQRCQQSPTIWKTLIITMDDVDKTFRELRLHWKVL